jgi:hypothetical protein
MESAETPVGSYEVPGITVVGSVRELTQAPTTHKYVNPNSDYIYPNGLTFNLS